jgi:CPA1 family monovalent cation:H+ antiporter
VPGWPITQTSESWHHVFTSWERFDALWFLRIASSGYRVDDPSAAFEDVSRAATLQYEGYLAAQAAMVEARAQGNREGVGLDQLRGLLGQATTVERALVLDARRRGEVSPASADEVLRDIESRALRDF